MVPEATIDLLDSKLTSVPLAFMALAAARAAKRGASLAECKRIAEEVRDHAKVFFAVDTLEFLHRGGRIGTASRFLGTALDLKPILTLRGGKIEAVEKVRTTKRAHQRLIELVEENVTGSSGLTMVGVVNAAAEEAAQALLDQIMERHTPQEVLLVPLSPVIGTHTGPGTVGVAFVTDVTA